MPWIDEIFEKPSPAGSRPGPCWCSRKWTGSWPPPWQEGGPAWDLVAVRGGEPDQMFDNAIAAMGGIQMFVPRGSNVLVKPNIGWDVPPERAGNTHPALVKRIVEHCLSAGAKNVTVFDHTCDNWTRTYRNSGIEKR